MIREEAADIPEGWPVWVEGKPLLSIQKTGRELYRRTNANLDGFPREYLAEPKGALGARRGLMSDGYRQCQSSLDILSGPVLL